MKPKKSIIQPGKRLFIHIILWVLVLIFFSFFIGIEGESIKAKFTFSAFFLPVTMTTTYVFIYNLIPNYLLPKRYFKFGLYSVYTFIISAVFIIMSAFYGFVLSFDLEWNDRYPISKSIFYIMITIYLVVVIACAFSLLKFNYSSVSKNKELQNRILETQLKLKEQQLKYLKMQIHPHFLFNTLNTLYAFALKNSDKTPNMILQLSNLLDYILYQTQKPLVFLSEEIKHLQDYIELEEKRFQENLDVNFKTENISPFTQIPPMLFLPFLENSFKHGKEITGALRIDILIRQNNGQLYFEIINSKGSTIQDQPNALTEKGIGLENVRQRLGLLFKEQYSLNIENQQNLFKVKLSIQLNSSR